MATKVTNSLEHHAKSAQVKLGDLRKELKKRGVAVPDSDVAVFTCDPLDLQAAVDKLSHHF